MASRAAPPTMLPGAPDVYDPAYVQRLAQVILSITEQARNPGEVVASALTLINGDFELPTTDSNLPRGGVFQVNGQLRISVAHLPHVNGLSGTGSVGSVTVTTS